MCVCIQYEAVVVALSSSLGLGRGCCFRRKRVAMGFLTLISSLLSSKHTKQLDRLFEAENDLKDAMAYNPWGVAPSALLAVQVAQKKQQHKRKSIKNFVVSQQHSSNNSEEQTDQ